MSAHSASLWKDYYLDNKDRLDAAVHTHALPTRKTVKKPSIGTFKVESSPYSSSATFSSPAPSSRSRRPSQQPAQPAPRRQTINSMTTHVPVYNEHLPPPNTELRIPSPPSRSPSPPTEVIPHNRGGNKFTKDDRAFFIKFMWVSREYMRSWVLTLFAKFRLNSSWRLKGDPTLLRHELCELLADKARKTSIRPFTTGLIMLLKAPHHNVQSWTSYWSSHHDLPDKILASMREENPDDQESSGEDEEEDKPKPKKKATVQRKPRYRELSSESELTEDSEEDEPTGVEQEDEAADDAIEIPPMDESDLAAVSRHVASLHDWADLTMQDRWSEFTRRYPQRALKSWNEYYRRNQNSGYILCIIMPNLTWPPPQRLIDWPGKIRKLNAAERETRQAPAAAPPPLPKPTWASP
ncbi:hypothetical protein C8R46DRAFT_1033361 [Mycena filopes]|nr:hypothetical protein C8R46DRAFT_1033361 [Mycena filopes]